jgi:hypothetical protein
MAEVTTSAEGSDVPAPGQLVTVRNRIWVASDVVKGNVAAGTAAGFGLLTWREGPAPDLPAEAFTTVACTDDRGRRHE